MIIVGAKGFAKEVLEILHQNNQLVGIAFYDDVNQDLPDLLFGKFPILKYEDQVREHFQKFGNEFTIGIGSHTQQDGTDLANYLDKLFEVLNTDSNKYGYQLVSLSL